MQRHAIVIGAGVVGLATAWRLHQRGQRVTVIDPSPASGASHAAAGMLAAVSEYAFEEESLLALAVPAARRYPEIVAELAEHTDVGTGYRDTSTLVVTADAADRERLATLQREQQRYGLRVEQLTAREARAREGLLGPSITAAFLAVDDHQVTPRRLAAAYLSALQRADDVTFVDGVARRLIWRGDRVIGVTAGRPDPNAAPVDHRFDEAGEVSRVFSPVASWASPVAAAGSQRETGAAEDETLITGDETIVANGLASPELAGLPDGLIWPIRPVHGDVLRARTPEHLQPLLTHTIRGLVHGRSVYLVPRADGTVVIGATEREDGRDAVLAGSVLQLLRDAQTLVPAVTELELFDLTARARPGTPDNAPILGRVAPGLIANTGTHRHGILLSAENAVVVADIVEGRTLDPALGAFDPWRWSPGGPQDATGRVASDADIAVSAIPAASTKEC